MNDTFAVGYCIISQNELADHISYCGLGALCHRWLGIVVVSDLLQVQFLVVLLLSMSVRKSFTHTHTHTHASTSVTKQHKLVSA